MTAPNPKELYAGLTVAIVGASGFVGRATVKAVLAAGHQALPIPALRLRSTSASMYELVTEAQAFDLAQMDAIVDAARLADVAINAAGQATPGAQSNEHMTGANSLLPAVLARIAQAAGWSRLVHISSAAVYGSGLLDEGVEARPDSPYGWSKLVGEQALTQICQSTQTQSAILRPTSVHGPERALTQRLTRIARSPIASVAGPGNRPTPQVGVDNVGAAALFLATCDPPPGYPVLQPWEGVTTAQLLRVLGRREPLHVPISMATTLLATARLIGRLSPRLKAEARRLEMIWFGQSQSAGWLETAGWTPPQRWLDGFIRDF